MNTTNYVGIHWQNKKSYESSKCSRWLQQKAITMSLRKLVDWTAPPHHASESFHPAFIVEESKF